MPPDDLVSFEGRRILVNTFTRMKRQTKEIADVSTFDGLKPLVTPGGTSIHMSAGGDRNYMFTQVAPSATWNITHNFGKYPSVTIQDTSGTEVEGEVTHNSVDDLTVVFNTAFAGVAILN